MLLLAELVDNYRVISFLEGTIEHLGDKYLILNTGGIGYKVIVVPKLLNIVANRKSSVKTTEDPELARGELVESAEGIRLKLHIHSQLNMREGTFDMYGFDKREDLELFHLLTSVL